MARKVWPLVYVQLEYNVHMLVCVDVKIVDADANLDHVTPDPTPFDSPTTSHSAHT